jgi:PAS domain S-box-containing protein
MKKLLKILIVEDNLSDAKLIKLELRKTNKEFESRIVQDEKNFLNELENFQPDLILSDYSMPQFTGLDALDIAKKKCPEIPFIIVTGTLNEETAIKCMRWGAWDYVLKDRLIHLGHAVKNAIKIKVENEKKKLAEEALKKSEEQFRLIAENTNDNIALITFDLKAKYVYVSPSVKSVLGYNSEDLLGKSFFDFIHPEDKKALFPVLKKYVNLKIKKLLTGKESEMSETIEFRFKDKTGNWRFMQSTVNIVGKQLLSVARDITEKKKAEEALRESEEKFREMANLLPQIVYEIDVQGNLTFVNKHAFASFGYSKKDYDKGINVFQTLIPEDIERAKENIQNIIIGKALGSPEYTALKKDGTTFPVLIYSSCILKDNKPVGIRGIIIDISERKKAEEALKQSEKNYRDLFNNATDAIYIQDREGRFLDVNQGAVEMYGYPKEFFIGKTPEFLSAPGKNNMKKIIGFVEDAFNGKPRQYDFWGIRKNGEVFPKIVRSQQGFYLGQEVIITYALDITERKKAEEAIKESEERFQKLLENVPTVAVQGYNPDGIINYWNKANELIYGYTAEEAIGKNLVELIIPPEMRDKVQKIIKNGAKTGEMPPAAELTLIRKNGKPVTVYSSHAFVKQSGKEPALFCMDMDLTERKQAEKVQKTLFNISNALNTTDKMQDLYSKIREFLGEVIDTTNFYVALYDEKTGMISLPFDVDEKDNHETFPAGKTLTNYVIQLGKPLFAPRKLQDELNEQGKIEIIGTPSLIWLGVPLKIGNQVIGVIVVQSYDKPNLYTEKDMVILSFVSDEIALAIKHKQADEQIKRDLEEKEILLQEVHHRVKNNMQIISSLLKLQSAHITDKRALELFQNSRDRVKTMALIHDALYRSKDLANIDFKDYVRKLTTQIFISYGASSDLIKMKINIKDILLDISTAIPCGLIINELVSNSLKYAFPKGRKGEINVSCTPKNQNYTLIVKDNGIGIYGEIDLENSPTLGLLLVNSLTKQLDSTLKLEKVKGTSFKIIFKKADLKTYRKV